jgi:phospholipase/carboxylesterase
MNFTETETPLEVVVIEDAERGDARGGTAVVLLHGWGAPGDDLVPLAEEIAQPGTTFYVPAAPLPEVGGGRAWWHLDLDRPPRDDGDGVLAAPHAAVAAARGVVQTLLAQIAERQAPERVYIGGFSQGAMLAVNVALAEAPAVDKVFALSGVMLADSLPALDRARARPPVFVAHGKDDQVLPFSAGRRLQERLSAAGFPVAFHAFDGGHEIPASIVAALRDFLFA